MREILKRSITGLLYVSILLFCIFSSENTYLLLFLFFGMLCLAEYLRLISYRFWHNYIILVAFLLFFAYYKVSTIATWLYLGISLATSIYLIVNLFSIRLKNLNRLQKLHMTVFYPVAGIVFLALLPSYNKGFNPEIVAGLFALIWINDTFAFVIGKSMGRNKLFERISPKKTIEGFAGGLIFACVGSYFIYKFTESLTIPIWIVLALVISSFGTLGDLIESKIKREAGVKDSGTLLPGHGGIYDRMDSILFASPFIYLTLLLTEHVS